MFFMFLLVGLGQKRHGRKSKLKMDGESVGKQQQIELSRFLEDNIDRRYSVKYKNLYNVRRILKVF